jgi:hypothetical protein
MDKYKFFLFSLKKGGHLIKKPRKICQLSFSQNLCFVGGRSDFGDRPIRPDCSRGGAA